MIGRYLPDVALSPRSFDQFEAEMARAHNPSAATEPDAGGAGFLETLAPVGRALLETTAKKIADDRAANSAADRRVAAAREPDLLFLGLVGVVVVVGAAIGIVAAVRAARKG